MDQRTISFSAKTIIVLGFFITLLVAGAVGWSYHEMSNMRRDLYNVREDYYGYKIVDGETVEEKVEYTVASQSVKKMRVADYDKYYEEEPPYEEKDVRVVELKVKNGLSYIYSYFAGALGAVDDNGVLIRSISVHEDDDLNTSPTQYGFELVPGGEATVYVYFEDQGREITELYDTEFSQKIQLN